MKYISSIKSDWKNHSIILSIAATLSLTYFRLIDFDAINTRMVLHDHIISGTAADPYRYRVLVPYLNEVFIELFSRILSYKISFNLSYAIYDFIAILFLLLTIYYFLTIWFTKEHSMFGILFISTVIILAFNFHNYQPWSLLETGLFTLGLILIYKQQHLLIALLMIVASLNRETSIFIPVAFFFTSIDIKNILESKKIPVNTVSWLCLYLLIWGVIYAGLRTILGNARPVISFQQIWAIDSSLIGFTLVVTHLTLFVGIFWVFAFLGYKNAPPFLKNLSLAIPFFVLPLVTFGILYEVRMFMFLYPILIGLGLSYLYPDDIVPPGK